MAVERRKSESDDSGQGRCCSSCEPCPLRTPALAECWEIWLPEQLGQSLLMGGGLGDILAPHIRVISQSGLLLEDHEVVHHCDRRISRPETNQIFSTQAPAQRQSGSIQK